MDDLRVVYVKHKGEQEMVNAVIDTGAQDARGNLEELLVALFADRWHHDSTEGFLTQPGSPIKWLAYPAG
ncbi:hypothetical protein TNCV_1353441 [Trichonephila clavipes]|nr:hypothetical protein TNCV_1353441 [Trichonephila clavipes]